ncbi:MAG: hypothetical protein A2W91_16775 [Bacteroidetes bacterium GWF2_38_335]|nr:MAG: hypothetical protein A2W91_16775 [Bacteroidetes bacterium GWF2_38_335]OFY81339.1 MAG: hypothetical protein A2281_07750 [Bacteroidetes bacterium RIFOXYA12_FULL_38_20]HBS85461.1 3-oxoacyl-ACP synthase [Bacteroidales bacterium]
MAFLRFNNVKISGIAAAVPSLVIDNSRFQSNLSEKETEKIISKTGIAQRRFAGENISSGDLAFAAAEKLINDMNINRGEIDLVIFLSQTPDYKIPTTSAILQHRLGLPKTTASFDINQGCSGYIYGLSTAFSYASQPGINKVLLLVSETLSKTLSKNDRNTSLLFGDGATATLIEKTDLPIISWFSLNTDGSGENAIKIPAGGYKNPSSVENLKSIEQEDGSIRTEHNLSMDGVLVFNFTVAEVVDDINRVLNFSGLTTNEIDKMIFHQSNRYMIDFFLKKLQYPAEKSPVSIHRFGNTSGVSIPLTIVSELQELNSKKEKILMCGYGSGLSWATAVTDLDHCHISKLIEIPVDTEH